MAWAAPPCGIPFNKTLSPLTTRRETATCQAHSSEQARTSSSHTSSLTSRFGAAVRPPHRDAVSEAFLLRILFSFMMCGCVRLSISHTAAFICFFFVSYSTCPFAATKHEIKRYITAPAALSQAPHRVVRSGHRQT